MRIHSLVLSALIAIANQGLVKPALATPYWQDSPLNLVDSVIQQQHKLQTAQIPKTRFKVRIENISRTDEFDASNGMKWTLDFSPGVWLVSDGSNPLFTVGKTDRDQGLEAIAEDGNPTQLADSLKHQTGVQSSGIFNTPVGATQPKGIRPGQSFEFTVTAAPGQKLSLATMFGQSNDWFYAPGGNGIALFDANGQPIRGDVTSQINLWDDGTEADEEPGVGLNQGPRQKMANSGPVDPNGQVRLVTGSGLYTKASQVMRVTITPE